jgi:hypothetical protein
VKVALCWTAIIGSAAPFVLFMLEMIRAAPDELDGLGAKLPAIGTEQAAEQVTEQVRRLLRALGDHTCPAKHLMQRLGLRHRPLFVVADLRPALGAGIVAMTDPGQPRSPWPALSADSHGAASAGNQIMGATDPMNRFVDRLTRCTAQQRFTDSERDRHLGQCVRGSMIFVVRQVRRAC